MFARWTAFVAGLVWASALALRAGGTAARLQRDHRDVVGAGIGDGKDAGAVWLGVADGNRRGILPRVEGRRIPAPCRPVVPV